MRVTVVIEGFEQRNVMICFQSFSVATLLRMKYVGVKVEVEGAVRNDWSHAGFDQNGNSGSGKWLDSARILKA